MNIPEAKQSLLTLIRSPREYSSKLAEWKRKQPHVFLSEVAVVLKYILIYHDEDQQLKNLITQKLEEISDDPEQFNQAP